MRKNKRTKRILIVLFVILCIGLVAGLTLGKYAGEWKHGFGLLISPTDQDDTDTTLRRYFRSNELLPVSENVAYTINGTSGWFSVANALDSSTVSQDTINYTLTWYVSTDGTTWTEHKTETGSFEKDEYKVTKYTVEPVTISGTTYNKVKVSGKTSSFLQEDIEAVYTFNYSNYSINTSFANGVITLDIDMNDVSGEFKFSWPEGIAPDNSDPSGLFKNAIAGPSNATVTLNKNTAYQFLFFVTDGELLEQLNNTPSNAEQIVTMIKK